MSGRDRYDRHMELLEAMTAEPAVVSVSPETTLKQVAELMVEHHISGVPVVDADRRVLGVVSEADIVTSETAGTGRAGVLARARALAGQRAGVSMPRTAGEAMTSPAVTIGSDRTVMQAAHVIADRGVNRLPVVDEDGRLVGMVTRADVVRAFVRSDEEIARELREGVVQRLVEPGSGTVQVAVADGEVLLTGEVDSSTTARLLEYLSSRAPGVVALRSELRSPEAE
jgi:CBS domain-containing protein